MKKLLLLALATFFGSAAFAQDTTKLQVAVDYSYLHTPQDSFVPGSSFNGGGASLSYFFFKHVGLKAEFTDYGSYAQLVTVPANTQGCNSQANCALSVHGNLFTYTVGPVLRFRIKRVLPFAEIMFGGAHNNIYANIFNSCAAQGECINLSRLPNNNAFDWVLGGGFDVPFREHIAFRPVEVNWVHTSFGNPVVIGNSTQNNLRVQAGIVLKF
jgi:Outer membrane protein beta-barrel domain